MALGDDIKKTAEEAIGKGKEALGKATGNDKLVAEGKADQVKAGVKKTAADVKDTLAGDK
ncbi:CsbD family protein [Lacisediminihabitans changchengi]|uniref:CsbD family protein n=1 Tax=Lacisediminihabitans changchengi TaxID=2787634 RepID=A0A934STE3_9MICO|nr:CsbD family protein [Lacisediminihabitans changchengi]MBK4348653.1 CsbD family protein [Lacisediminihabitans changchengi]